MHEPHIAVNDSRHGSLGHFGVTVGNGNSVLLMEGQQELGVTISQVVHDAVVKTAKAGPGIESNVLNSEPS
jgi:hypothetical protein